MRPRPRSPGRRATEPPDRGIAGRIRCPTLVLEAENDATFRGEARQLIKELTCPYDHVLLTDAEGAGEHCHEGAMLAFHQRAFDWIDDVLRRRSHD